MFELKDSFESDEDAQKYQISTFDPIQMAKVEASLDIYNEAGGIEVIY